MKNLAFCAVVAVLLVGPALAQGDQEHDHASHWLNDYDDAVKVAVKEKKDLLVDFTGSDWCGWCIRLDKEVFDHHEFLDEAMKSYVLVKLDFPQGEEAKAKVKNPKRNEELSRQWGISGFPSILLVTAEGDVFGRTGYQEGGPEKYVAHLAELSTNGKKNLVEVSALKAAYATAKDGEKMPLVEKAIALLSAADENTVGVSTMAKIAKDAFTLDPKNEKGMQMKAAKALLAAGQSDDTVTAAAKTLDPKNENGLLEQIVFAEMRSVNSEEAASACLTSVDALIAMGPIKDNAVAQNVYANAAFWNHKIFQNAEKAKAYATKLKALKDLPEHFNGLIKEILGE